MSTIPLHPVETISPLQADALYRPADYALIVAPEGDRLLALHRISIETLTLLFRADDSVLVGFDAYTNAERWERKKLDIPAVAEESALICAQVFDEHGIGESGTGPVRYAYSEETALLLIQIGNASAVRRIRCLRCLICGLGAGGELIELWLQDLKFGA